MLCPFHRSPACNRGRAFPVTREADCPTGANLVAAEHLLAPRCAIGGPGRATRRGELQSRAGHHIRAQQRSSSIEHQRVSTGGPFNLFSASQPRPRAPNGLFTCPSPPPLPRSRGSLIRSRPLAMPTLMAPPLCCAPWQPIAEDRAQQRDCDDDGGGCEGRSTAGWGREQQRRGRRSRRCSSRRRRWGSCSTERCRSGGHC